MNQIVKKGADLPASVAAMAGLANSVAVVGAAAGGEQFLKMTKFGEFVFGMEDLEVEEGSTWAINPTQFQHGWICWGTKQHGTDGECLGEVMAPAAGPLPEESSLPSKPGNWTKQISISLRCMDGEDEGIQAVFKTNSLGGRKAYAAIVGEVVAKIQDEDVACVPVVTMEADSYTHKKYGKIFTPEFKIVEWITLDGLAADADPEEEEDEEEEAPKKRTRKKAASKKRPSKKAREKEPEPEPEPEEEEEEEAEEPAPRRRRRRRS